VRIRGNQAAVPMHRYSLVLRTEKLLPAQQNSASAAGGFFREQLRPATTGGRARPTASIPDNETSADQVQTMPRQRCSSRGCAPSSRSCAIAGASPQYESRRPCTSRSGSSLRRFAHLFLEPEKNRAAPSSPRACDPRPPTPSVGRRKAFHNCF